MIFHHSNDMSLIEGFVKPIFLLISAFSQKQYPRKSNYAVVLFKR